MYRIIYRKRGARKTTLNFIKRTAAVITSAIMFTGCGEFNLSVDGLLSAPKLTDQQSQIHSALISSVGRNITLRYPREGNNRSAFVISNLDDDPSDEALVFYEYTGAENEGIRINLLDTDEKGEWHSVKEVAGAGTEIERVVISEMGNSGDLDILVGFQNMTGENTLEIYSYSDGDFKRLGSDNYSLLEPIDINSDGKDELITIQRVTDPETAIVTTKAYLLKIADGEIVKDDGINMCENVQSYIGAYGGKLENGDPAVYIDEIDVDGQLRTEIIYFRYSGLQNPMELRSEKLLPLCTRPSGYNCADLDGNGVYLIPSTRPMLGYENAVAEEQILKTTWNSYVDFYELKPKYSGYHSVSDGYTLVFPQRWTDEVTVKIDPDSAEAVFYRYSGDINADMPELMRIKAASKDESEEYLHNGYRLIRSQGQIDYLVKLSASVREKKLVLTIDEVQNCFYIINNF